MSWVKPRVVGGSLLVVLGVLVLLQTLGIFSGAVELLLAALMGVAGVYFLGVFRMDSAGRWWAALPGVMLLDLAVLALLGLVSPSLACTPRLGGWVFSCSELAGVVFLAGMGLSFWLVYIANRAQWWAVIPAGALLTLAVVTLVSTTRQGTLAGGVFFLGMGVTFLVVGFLPTPGEKMAWAFIPAGILIAAGVVIIAALNALTSYLWALSFIALGVWLLLRARQRT